MNVRSLDRALHGTAGATVPLTVDVDAASCDPKAVGFGHLAKTARDAVRKSTLSGAQSLGIA